MYHQDVFSGVTPAQQLLVGYWKTLQDRSGLVHRARIDPGALRSMLACISIVEFDDRGEGRFRIAGSRLRDIFGMEVRGMRVDEIAGTHGDCYALGLSAALERCQPVGGLIRDAGRSHCWLRLPLAGEGGQLNQVLCHDELIARPAGIVPGRKDGSIPISGRSRHAA